jgi:hypothetical protein
MHCEDRVSTDSLRPASGGWHCRSMQGFLMLSARGRAAGSATQSAGGRTSTKSDCASFPADVARAFQMETGYATSAIALTEAVNVKLELARFLAADGSSAAVLVMDAQVLSRVWPPCDWKAPLLRVRNRLADEGSKFFVALTTRHQKRGVIGALARLQERLVVRRVRRYCNREGIGFLGAVQTTRRWLPHAASTHFMSESPLSSRTDLLPQHSIAATPFVLAAAPSIN